MNTEYIPIGNEAASFYLKHFPPVKPSFPRNTNGYYSVKILLLGTNVVAIIPAASSPIGIDIIYSLHNALSAYLLLSELFTLVFNNIRAPYSIQFHLNFTGQQ